MACCNAIEITTLVSSRIAAMPLPSFAPDRNTFAGRPSSSKPTVADKIMLPTMRLTVSARRRFGSRPRHGGSCSSPSLIRSLFLIFSLHQIHFREFHASETDVARGT
jgi:hypothetical protein